MKRHAFFSRLINTGILFLAIEFFDELSYGSQSAALPVQRVHLGLDYAQVGMLLGVSGMLGTLIEPLLLLLGDTRWRKQLIVGGGVVLAASLALLAGARSFPMALLAFCLMYPASGAFVTLSQATLMDQNPQRREQMMARWTAAGSTGNLVGPLLLSGFLLVGLVWRQLYLGFAVLGLILALAAWTALPGSGAEAKIGKTAPINLHEIYFRLVGAVRAPGLVKWLLLLELADLLMDVYLSYISLYLADVVGLPQTQIGLVLGGVMLASLLTDLALIPLLERVQGLKLVRLAALAGCILYPALLLAPWTPVKIALAILVRFTTLGWYAVLQAEAFGSLPEHSATVTALNSAVGLVGKGLTLLVGLAAAQLGLPAAMWLLLAGPLALAVFLPSRGSRNPQVV